MKGLIIFIIFTSFFSCKAEKNEQLLSDGEWREILNSTLTLAEATVPYIFKEYENVRLKNIIESLYTNCTDLGYETNDKISEYITERTNRSITNKLDTMFNVSFISDTINFKDNYIIYSEPFYVNNDILCISMSNRKVDENSTSHMVFFLRKQNGVFKIIEFYDVNKDQFYMPTPI